MKVLLFILCLGLCGCVYSQPASQMVSPDKFNVHLKTQDSSEVSEFGMGFSWDLK